MSDTPTTRREISRHLPDIQALKALAHPDRLRLLGRLRVGGPSTATALGQRLGLNSGAASYHLRQLYAHGFIEPAEELGNRRDRWWRARHESTTFETADLAGDDLEVGLAFTQAVLSRHMAMMQQAHDDYRELPPAWRRASTSNDFIIPMTADAAAAFNERVEALLWEAKAAGPAPREPAPAGQRPVAYIFYAFPLPEDGL